MAFFLSPHTKERFYHRVTFTKYKGGATLHYDENRNQLLCPVSNEPLVPEPTGNIELMVADATPTPYGEFVSMSPERKQKVLQKRADDNFIKVGGPEKQRHMFRTAVGK